MMLFMKGTPSNPVCGFSYRVVQILKHLGELSVFALTHRLRLCKREHSDEQVRGEEFEVCEVRMAVFPHG